MSEKEQVLASAPAGSGFSAAVWDFFCSLRLTIALLILLATTSIIGTVIQQNLAPQDYLRIYSERTVRLFETLGFFDMYRSWWFLSLLALFSVNLIACSIKRLPRVWKTVTEPVLVPGEAFYRSFSNTEEMTVSASLPEVRERLSAFFGRSFAGAVMTGEGEKVHFFAQKGAYARFGVYVTHLSILIIFIGAMIGNIWGYKAYVNIVEGTATDKVWPRGKDAPIDLGFSVRADDFDVSFYEGTNRPKEFMSILDVVDGGREVVTDRKIVVNSPLTYKGITFYQSSYGPAGDPTFKIKVRSRETGEVREVVARQGQHLPLPDGGSFAVTAYAPSYEQFGPAVQMHVSAADGGGGAPFVLLQNYPDFDAARGAPYILSLISAEQPYYTGLQVAKDPGVWVVWTGCALLVIGSLVAFFLSHRRIWVTLQPVGKGTGVRIGGSAHRNQPAFELFFDGFKKDLKKEISA